VDSRDTPVGIIRIVRSLLAVRSRGIPAGCRRNSLLSAKNSLLLDFLLLSFDGNREKVTCKPDLVNVVQCTVARPKRLLKGDALYREDSFGASTNPGFTTRADLPLPVANLQFALARNVLATGATSNHLINGLGFFPV
jgi:hypothetical protein